MVGDAVDERVRGAPERLYVGIARRAPCVRPHPTGERR
jgi:hypothetical protein